METSDSRTVSHLSEFRKCREEDFVSNGFKRKVELGLEKLLCPNTESLGNSYKLKNLYSQKIERTAVSFEIITCNKEFTDDCASEEDIASLLDHLIFSQYFITEGIDFQNEDNFHQRPVVNDVKFYQQF